MSEPRTDGAQRSSRGMVDVAAVLEWGGPRLRDLPWRATRDPWAILVAEVMLQQTQAERVIPKWQEFLAEFPTPAECATASLGDVLRLWQGLGYPRRARNLQRAAQLVVAEHGGVVPRRVDQLLALPGVGRYTARAVAVFAFEDDVAVVETNIARLLARVAGRRLRAKEVQAVADELTPTGQGWLWNQVLMDLGATTCRPRPVCERCPTAHRCHWSLAGRPELDPAVGSAGVSGTQAPFAGSARQARGAVLRRLAIGPSPVGEFDAEILDSLVADGLVVATGDGDVRLP